MKSSFIYLRTDMGKKMKKQNNIERIAHFKMKRATAAKMQAKVR